jgi:hypothetical protein
MEDYDSAAVTATSGRGSLIGVCVCPKCNIINKIRSDDIVEGDKCKCRSCGETITVEKWMKH